MTSSLEKKILGGLGLAGLVIAGVAVIGHLATARIVRSADSVARCQTLITALADVWTHVQSVRMSSRGYAVTGDEDIARTLNDERAHTDQHVAELREIASRYPMYGPRLARIEAMVSQRLSDGDRLTALRQKFGGLVAGPAALVTYRSDVDDPLRLQIESMLADTRRELATRERIAAGSAQAMFYVLVFSALVELAFAISAAGVIRRGLLEVRKHATEVEQKELTLRSFFDSGVTMMGIVELLDDDIRLVSENGATSQFLMDTGGEARGADNGSGTCASHRGVPRDVIKMWMERYRESLYLGGRVEFEYEHPTPAGSRWLSAVVCPIRRWAPAGQPRFSYVVLDVTARKAAEHALRRHTAELAATKAELEQQSAQLEQARTAADAATAAKNAFLANMSHEIRTPLAALLGYSDLLADPARGDAERLEWAGVIRRNARHLLELINDVLDLSRIEAGHMILEKTACDPAQVLADVVAMMHPRATEKGLTLRLELDSNLPGAMMADALRLRQIFINLVGNAVKFTEAGEISVWAACDRACAQTCATDGTASIKIAVRDTGIGMSADQIERMGRPFTQADQTLTRRFGGTGLGLTIMQRLVHLMGGTMEVKSDLGIGSVFTVTIPVLPVAVRTIERVNVAAGQSDAAGDEEAGPRLDGARILLVEDTPDSQHLIAFYLERNGATVVMAGNGREALDAVAAAGARGFDVILMDMQMPEVDGYTATAELRRRGVATPVIAITAHAMVGDEAHCLEAGCTDYLTKPVEPARLMRRIASYLTHARAA